MDSRVLRTTRTTSSTFWSTGRVRISMVVSAMPYTRLPPGLLRGRGSPPTPISVVSFFPKSDIYPSFARDPQNTRNVMTIRPVLESAILLVASATRAPPVDQSEGRHRHAQADGPGLQTIAGE